MIALRAEQAARAAVNRAVHDGILIRPETCSKCGATGRIEGHHDDYSKPLNVRWLCRSCHRVADRERYQGGPGEVTALRDLPVESLLSIKQVAERLRIHPTRVRLLVRLGELRGEKPARDWMIEEASVTEYEARRRPRRNPKEKAQ